ncbi:preprotein translocase subunit YajC [Candidatus Legionella polyplacis]|uniref:Sec translocon accessory complex subunit YajC n=1 Tax=Candidatus Legionella polyplacis TaxID=2005262 RepID=A0ABZ2H099_9GAMM|nr:preprotein translocase subunit YajC [Candidatus Legionella polyplacis]ATW02033.1 preprotein translocase subunit YajC [Candidatus Legionella polyplacis]
MILIHKAFASYQSSSLASSRDSIFSLLMIVGIFILFYLVIIRPQYKRAKEHRDMIGKLRKGDEVIISNGILGKIVQLTSSDYIKVMISDGVEIYLQKQSVSVLLPKGTLKSFSFDKN